MHKIGLKYPRTSTNTHKRNTVRSTHITSSCVPVFAFTLLAADMVLQQYGQDKLLPLLYLANKVIVVLILKQHTHNWERDSETHPHIRAITQTALVWQAVVSEGRMDTSQQPAVLMEPGPSVALPICHPLQGTHTHIGAHVHTQPSSQPMNQSSPALPRPPLTAVRCLTDKSSRSACHSSAPLLSAGACLE